MNPSTAELHTPFVRVRQLDECNYLPQASTALFSANGHIGEFVVLEQDGRLSAIHEDHSINKVTDFRNPVKLAFSNGCIVVATRDGVGFRSILTPNSCLKEFRGSNPDGSVLVEISKEQAQVLSSLDTISSSSLELSAFLNEVKKLHAETEDDVFIRCSPTKGLVNELESLINRTEGTGSHAHYVVEKIRFCVDPFKPYNFDVPVDGLPYSPEQDICRVANMTSEAARRLSFYKWPKSECLFAQPENLANAGFFLRPSAGNLDRVCCFSCEVCLVNWEPQDDPIREHVEHNSKCNFINGLDKRNVTFEETKSVLPFLSWGQIEQSDEHISVEEVLIGNCHSSCSWVATAVTPLPGHNKPSVFLFDLNKVAQKPVEILLDLYTTCMAGSHSEDPRRSTGAFDWLNSINDVANMIDKNQKTHIPLCKITSLCTTTSLGENVQITNNDKIVAILCTSVLVDDARLKKSLNDEVVIEEVLTLNRINTFCEATRIDELNQVVDVHRRPFILVHHVVEFPTEVVTEPLMFVFQAAGKNSDELLSDQPERQVDVIKSRESEYIPIYYNAKETVAIGIQCIRLPPEFDNTDFKVSNMHFGEDGSKLLVVVDPSSTELMDFSSSLLVYTRIPALHMFRLEPALKFTLKKKVKNVYFLGNEYFGASTTSRDCARSTEPLNETVVIHYADGTLELMDLDFCHFCKIDIQNVLDVTIKSSTSLMALTTEGKFATIEIHNSIPTCHSDYLDELIVTMLESSAGENIDEQKFKEVSRKGRSKLSYQEVVNSIRSTPAGGIKSFNDLTKLFKMIKSQPLCQQSTPATDRNMPNGSAANLQNAVGVSIQTSSEFLEYIPSKNRGSPHNLAILSATNCQEFSAINKYPYNELFSSNHDGTRIWQFKVQKEDQTRTFIMEMTVSFGLNLSHLNITIGFSGFVRGNPDITMTIYIAKSGNSTVAEDLGDVIPSLQALPGPSSGFSVEHYLDFLSQSKDILETNCEKVCGPMGVADFIDGEGKQAVVQVSVVPLLLSAAAVSKRDGCFTEGWLAGTHRFYVVFEVNEALTDSQIEFTELQNNLSQFKDSVYSAGLKRTRNAEAPSGGIIPLPQGRLTISGEKKKQYTKTKFTTRKRNQALSMVADIVTTNILDPFYNVSQKKDIVSSLEYVAVSAFQYSKPLQRPNFQRCLLSVNRELHCSLLEVLAGVSEIVKSEPYYKTITAQLCAVDLLQFVVSNFRTTKNTNEASKMLKRFIDLMPFLIYNCFVVSPRTVAQKMSVFICDLMELASKTDVCMVETVFMSFTQSILDVVSNQQRFRSAGAAHCLTVLIYSACKLVLSKSSSTEALNSVQKLQQALSSIILEISRLWCSKRKGSYSQSSRSLSLNDLYLYNYPAQTAAWVLQTDRMEAASASGKGTYGAILNQSECERSFLETRKRIPAAGYKSMLFPFGESLSKNCETAKTDKNNKSSLNTALATMLIYDESKDVEMKWFEHAGISTLIASQGKPKQPEKKMVSSLGATRRAIYAASGNADDGFKHQPLPKSCNEVSDDSSLLDSLASSSCKSIFETLQTHFGADNVSRLDMGGEFFPGLLESERLFIEVVNSSHQVRIVDMNANRDIKMNADVKVDSSTPLPADDFNVEPELNTITQGIQARFDFERKRAVMPSQSKNLKILYGNARSSDKKAEMFNGLAEMYVLGCHNKFILNSQNSPSTSRNEQCVNKNGRSDSFFYDDMNVDTDCEFVADLEADDEASSSKGQPVVYESKRLPSRESKSVVFKRPPMLFVELDSCHAGQVLHVILDLHVPVLITDVIIPPNEILSAVAIDGWLDDERNKTRIVYSTEIERRALVLSNLSSAEVVRYIKLSYTIRDARKNKTSFMVGNFHGIRFFSPWNLYNFDFEDELLDIALKMNSINLCDVEKATIRYRRRYETLASQAKKLLIQGGPDGVKAYHLAMADRILFNTFNNILQRARMDMRRTSEVLKQWPQDESEPLNSEIRDWYGSQTNFLEFSWNKKTTLRDAPADELKCVLQEWMSLSNEINFLLQTFKKNDVHEGHLTRLNFMDLNSAVLLFGCLTCDLDPSIQARSCAFIFHHGNKMNWWPDFFPAVISRYFVNGSSDQLEDAFVRLVFLCHHSVQHNDLRLPIMERFLQYIIDLCNTSKSSLSIDTSQLSWALLLMSNAFDVIVPNTRYLDRWSFLSGQSCMNYLPNLPTYETSNRRYTRKVGTVKDNNYWGNTDISQSYFHGTGMPMQSTDKHNQVPVIEQPTWVELRRLATDIKNLGKDLDSKLHNNQISPDSYHMLKKEQKQLNQLYHTSQSYLTKGSMNFEGLFEKVFQSGLDKSTESTSQAPLATQEDIEEDKTKTDQNQHTIDLKQKLVKMRKNLQILLKQIKYSHYSRKKINESGLSRSRRFAVRMKLKNDVVVKSIQLLINLFCHKGYLLSHGTQLLLFKICAKLSVHGCAIPVSFREIMDSVDMTKELLACVFENADQNEWIRHAFLSFVLDVVESENAIHTVLSTDAIPTTSVKQAQVSDPDESVPSPYSEGCVKRRKGEYDERDSPMEEGVLISSSPSCHLDEKIYETTEFSKTLVTSGLLDPTSTCGIANEERDFHPGLCDTRTAVGLNPTFPFSFNLLDHPNEEEVDLLILMAMITLKPLELKTPPLWNNYRTWFVRIIAYNVARAHYNRGEPLSDMFRWFDYVVGAEMEAANSAINEGGYMKWALLSILNPKDFIEREFNLSSNKNVIPDQKTPSHSALDCAIFYSDFYSMYETSNHPMDVDDEQMFLPLDDRFEGIYSEVIQIMKGSSTFGSFNEDLEGIIRSKSSKELAPNQNKELSQFYDDCETTYLPIDSSEDVLQYVASRRVMPLNHAIFSFSKLRFLQSVLQVRRCLKGVSLQSPNIGDLLKNVTLDTPYVKPVNDLVTIASKPTTVNQDICRVLEKYEIELGLNFLNVHLTPFQLGVASLTYSSLEQHPSAQFWRNEAEKRVHAALAFKRMSPSISRTVKSSTLYDSSAPPSSGGTCCGWICQALGELICDMDVHRANQYDGKTNRLGGGKFLQYLAIFFSDLQGNVSSQKNIGPELTATQNLFVLSENAVSALMSFVVDFNYLTDEIWINLFKILISVDVPPEGKDATTEGKNYKFTHWVENSVYFENFIHKFFTSSLSRFSRVTRTLPTYGPAVCTIFRRFIQIVFTKQPSQVVMDSVLRALSSMFKKSREFGYLTIPVDVLIELTNSIDIMEKVCPCDPAAFADFFTSFIDFIEEFFSEIKKMQTHFPRLDAGFSSLQSLPSAFLSTVLESTPIPSNMCFSVTLSTKMQRDRNASLIERLRNSGNSSAGSGKTSKNITFVKRADILENTVRDGEVNVGDQFMQCSYSLMRMVVRYVSQYRPHILKRILHTQLQAVQKLICTMFMFIPYNANVEDITKDGFKIVTLADAVVHLLLIISETSMEDPDCCRQFIKVVIHTLRSRIERKWPTTDINSMLLMDLPVPVLMLLKSLLLGVSRCQIFVDEGGHTFVAEQLQLALEACSHNWPQVKRFNSMTKQLNVLSTHFTGIEPLSANLPFNHTPAAVDEKILKPTISSQQTRVSDGFGGTSASENIKEPIKYSLTYPSVNVVSPNNQYSSQLFGSRLSISVKTSGNQNSQPLPPNVFNFTPTCLLKSDTAAVGQLSALTLISEKRGRVQTFQHRFPPKKHWLDLTFVLPYKIVLYEVAIKIPDNMTHGIPSAIQVELCSDPSQYSWQPLSAPVIPNPVNHIRISTYAFKFPVTAVRLHLKSPTTTNLIALSQIYLLGSTSAVAVKTLNESDMFESTVMNHWISLFSRLCARIDVPVWQYAPTLSEALIRVYLCGEHNPEIVRQIQDLLLKLDSKNKPSPSCLILSIVNHLTNEGRISPKTYLSVAELLFTSCSFSAQISQTKSHNADASRPIHVIHGIIVSRQRQLLQGVEKLLTETLDGCSNAETGKWVRSEVLNEVAVFLWASACALWHNIGEESVRCDTNAICLEFASSLTTLLCNVIINFTDKTIFEASCWLLCTLVRASPLILSRIVKLLAQDDESILSPLLLKSFGIICQSQSAVKYLMEKNFVQRWTSTVANICQSMSHHKINLLVALVECLSELMSIDLMIEYFDSNEGGAMFRSLIEYLVKFCSSNLRSSEQNGHRTGKSLIESAIILFRKCLAYGGAHRDRIALILSDLINQSSSSNRKGVPLPETMETLIVRLIITDESIPVRLTGVVQHKNDAGRPNLQQRMMHPLFGCNQDDRIMEISLGTFCEDFLPCKKTSTTTEPSTSKASKTMDNYIEDLFLGTQLNLVDEFAEEKESISQVENKPRNFNEASTEYPYTYKQFAIQVSCGAYSTKHALDNKWSLAKVVDGLKAIRRFNHKNSEGSSLLERCLRDDQEEMEIETPHSSRRSFDSTRSRTPSTSGEVIDVVNEGDMTDGYFMLNLKIRASLQNNMLSKVDEELLLKNFLTDLPPQACTLLRFARTGGLKALSNSVDIMGRVTSKLKCVSTMLNKLTNPQLGPIKEEVSKVRKMMSRFPSYTGSQSKDQSGFSALNAMLQRPIFAVLNVLRILSACEAELKTAELISKGQAVEANVQLDDFASFSASQMIFDDEFEEDGIFTNIDDFDDPVAEASTSSALTNVPAKIIATLPVFSSVYDTDEFEQATSDAFVLPSGFNGQKIGSIPLEDWPAEIFAFGDKNTRATGSNTYYENFDMIVVAMSVFLEIDVYGPALVDYNRPAAKKLIYIMLGITPPESCRKITDGLNPALPQSVFGQNDSPQASSGNATQKDHLQKLACKLSDHFFAGFSAKERGKKTDTVMDQLALVPFFVLSKCFEENYPPTCSIQQAETVRIQAMTNGTIDVLMTLLSYYSHQSAKKKPIRCEGDFSSTKLLEQLISFNEEYQQIVELCLKVSKPATTSSAFGTTGSSLAQMASDLPIVGPATSQLLQQFGAELHNSSISTNLPKQIPTPVSSVIFPSYMNALPGMSKTSDSNFWAKGTGFGSGNTNTHWNLSQHVAKQKQHEVTVTCLLNILTNIIRPMPTSTAARLQKHVNQNNKLNLAEEITAPASIPQQFEVPDIDGYALSAYTKQFCEILQNSCLTNTLSAYMLNDSVLDISCHSIVYEAVVALLLAICKQPVLQSADKSETFELVKLITDPEVSGIYEGLKRICQVVGIYMSRLNTTSVANQEQSLTIDEEETLPELLKVSECALKCMEKIFEEDNKSQNRVEMEVANSQDDRKFGIPMIEGVYIESLKEHQFKTVPFFRSDNTSNLLFGFHYQANLPSSSGGSGKRMRRLAQEVVSLSNSLPLSLSSSVFVRAAEERLDIMKVLITGPSDTPYSGGCFEFDVFFPQDYPTTPMMMNLQTTGNRSVRFNPNLYEEGKVCLSILNTWSGRPEERWNPAASSFLQVLVSIQSLILVSEPYFNEPGFERSRGTVTGDQANREYTANIRHQCVRWAMIEMLRNPPKAFEDVIKRHFYVKRDEICEQVTEWIKETKNLIDKNQSVKVLPQHLTLLEKNFDALMIELNRLECPDPTLSHLSSIYLNEYREKSKKTST